MSVVNRFNVNSTLVKLDADIIENMSANDVSYNDSAQYNENTVGSKLSELESKTDQQGIYDVSAHNNGAVFESLSSLLNNDNLSALIPVPIRCGGMSIRFIQGTESNSDNKYVQYRYMGTATTGTPNPFLDTANWQGVDDEPTAGSHNLVESGCVAGVLNKVSEISKEDIPASYDDFIVVEDEDGNTIVEISPGSVNAKNLKINGVDVATVNDLGTKQDHIHE